MLRTQQLLSTQVAGSMAQPTALSLTCPAAMTLVVQAQAGTPPLTCLKPLKRDPDLRRDDEGRMLDDGLIGALRAGASRFGHPGKRNARIRDERRHVYPEVPGAALGLTELLAPTFKPPRSRLWASPCSSPRPRHWMAMSPKR